MFGVGGAIGGRSRDGEPGNQGYVKRGAGKWAHPPGPDGGGTPPAGSAEKQKSACKLGRARSVAKTRLYELNLATPHALSPALRNGIRRRVQRVQRVRSNQKDFLAVGETIHVGIRV